MKVTIEGVKGVSQSGQTILNQTGHPVKVWLIVIGSLTRGRTQLPVRLKRVTLPSGAEYPLPPGAAGVRVLPGGRSQAEVAAALRKLMKATGGATGASVESRKPTRRPPPPPDATCEPTQDEYRNAEDEQPDWGGEQWRAASVPGVHVSEDFVHNRTARFTSVVILAQAEHRPDKIETFTVRRTVAPKSMVRVRHPRDLRVRVADVFAGSITDAAIREACRGRIG